MKKSEAKMFVYGVLSLNCQDSIRSCFAQVTNSNEKTGDVANFRTKMHSHLQDIKKETARSV